MGVGKVVNKRIRKIGGGSKVLAIGDNIYNKSSGNYVGFVSEIGKVSIKVTTPIGDTVICIPHEIAIGQSPKEFEEKVDK